jgi:hypothetical protein
MDGYKIKSKQESSMNLPCPYCYLDWYGITLEEIEIYDGIEIILEAKAYIKCGLCGNEMNIHLERKEIKNDDLLDSSIMAVESIKERKAGR